MSGNYGWGGKDRTQDFGSPDPGFSRARSPYANGPAPDQFSKANMRSANLPNMSQQVAASAVLPKVDLSARKTVTSTAKNVLIVALDRTGSMGDWRKEIFQRLALLFKESQKYLGESTEILFIGFGDLGFNDTVEAAPFGAGPELDGYLIALGKDESGGGNRVESSEMAALFAAQNVDTRSAQNVFYFTVTDEGHYPQINSAWASTHLGIDPGPLTVEQMFQSLKVKANVFTILAQTGTLDTRTQQQWQKSIGTENVIELDDARRVVDVILGVVAKLVGQFNQFTGHLKARQDGTKFGAVNVGTVLGALSHVASPTGAVPARTRSLMFGVTPK